MAASGNNFGVVMRTILADAVVTLQPNLRFILAAQRTYEPTPGSKGSKIEIPVAGPVSTGAAVPTHNPLDVPAINITNESIDIDQHRQAAFALTDKQVQEIEQNRIVPETAKQAVKSLATEVDTFLAAKAYKRVYNMVGTPGTTPFASDLGVAARAKQMLDRNDVPSTDRVAMVDDEAEYNLLNLEAFRAFDKRGDNSALKDAYLGNLYGMDFGKAHRIPIHTPGTATGITLISNDPVGDTVVTLKVASGSGTLVRGDIITITGQAQQYVVTADVNLDTTGVPVTINPPLKTAVNGSGTPVVVNKAAAHTANLAMHKSALQFASRPMNDVVTPGVLVETIVDPVSKLNIRLQVIRQTFQTAWVFDILYGGDLIRPELATRIAG